MDMEADPKKSGISDDTDPRLDFLERYVTKSMRLKSEKWQKMMSVEDHREMIIQFYRNPKQPTLFFYLDPAGSLCPNFTFPVIGRSKSCYFVRVKPLRITRENYTEMMVTGDLCSRPVEQLGVFVEEIITPLLSNRQNTATWPRVVQTDCKSHLKGILNCVYEIRGFMENKTMLPMPLGVERIPDDEKPEDCDLSVRASIEGVVIKWTRRLGDVIAEDSARMFHQSSAKGCGLPDEPGPEAELQFWDTRLANLEYVYSQLRDPRVKKMAAILEKTQSVFYPCYMKMFRDCVAALNEAREISIYLHPMRPHYERFESTPFADAAPLIGPLLHCTTLVWANCRYYCNNARIVVLLRQTCNMVIEQSARSLDPRSLLRGEPDDGHQKITAVLKTLNLFRKTFEEYRADPARLARTPDFTPPASGWTFRPDAAFERFDRYTERLRLLDHILVTAVEFLKLEKVELGGVTGRPLGLRIAEIYEEFTTMYGNFGSVRYDPLDPECERFKTDFDSFQKKCCDLDRRLAATLEQALDDIFNIDSLFKIIFILGGLPERPIIRERIGHKFGDLLSMFEQQIKEVREIFAEGVRKYEANPLEFPVDKWHPPVAGTVTWLRKLKARITKPRANFEHLEEPILSTPQGVKIYKKYNDTIEMMENFENDVLDAWKIQVPGILKNKLPKYLIVKRHDKILETNFDEELVTVLREMLYLTRMEITNLPESGNELFLRNEEIQNQSGFYQKMWTNSTHMLALKKKNICVKLQLLT